MNHLNKEQQRAVRHKDGPMLVLAGPGSGKTAVLTERIAFLIEEGHIPPEHILVLTFSRKAALEMQNRFRIRHNSHPVHFGTFHSVFYHIYLQQNNEPISIITDKQKLAILTDLCHKLQIPQVNLKMVIDLIDGISFYKNHHRIPEYMNNECRVKFMELSKAYDIRLRDAGLVDFDDMLLRSYELLMDKPDILAYYREWFRYILVDEFQDCNDLQYTLVKLLAGQRANIFAVGDDDQSIYGFRGADSGVMQRYLSDYPQCTQIHLLRNYRCCSEVIDAAYQLVSHNTARIRKPKQLPSLLKGKGIVRIIRVRNAYEEAEEACN